MNLEQAKCILKSLQELTIDTEDFDWGSCPEFAKTRQIESIQYMETFIKELEHQKLRNDLGVGMLNSLSLCEVCGEETFIWKMAGGGECRNPDCNHDEICF